MALNLRSMYGAWVDEALGGAEPMVDDWEEGKSLPTDEQLEKLAEPAWFCRPADELGGPMRTFICDRVAPGPRTAS